MKTTLITISALVIMFLAASCKKDNTTSNNNNVPTDCQVNHTGVLHITSVQNKSYNLFINGNQVAYVATHGQNFITYNVGASYSLRFVEAYPGSSVPEVHTGTATISECQTTDYTF